LNNRPIKSKGTGTGDMRPGEELGRIKIKLRAKGKILTIDEKTTFFDVESGQIFLLPHLNFLWKKCT
jgi:hypothetical protein